MFQVYKQNRAGYEKLGDDNVEKYHVSNYNRFANSHIYDSDEHSSLFDFQSADDPNLQKLEEKKNEKTATEHTTGILMALSAGALYGVQAIIVKQAVTTGISITECLLTRSIFQIIVMPIYALCKNQSFQVSKEYRWSVFWICLWYSLASTFVFGAFSLILPDAAVAGRSASRTICSVIFTLVLLREKLTILDFSALALSIGGIVFMGLSTTQLNDFYITNSWRITGGFALCFLGGLSRSFGLTKYRVIKGEVFPETIVFWHAVQSVLINVPLMLILQNYSMPDKNSIVWLAGLCLSATGGTLLSNKAIQFTNPGLVSMGQSIDLSISTAIEHSVYLQTPPRLLEYIGAILIMIGGITVPIVKACRKTFGLPENS